MHFLYGFIVGEVVGAFLGYKFLGRVVRATVAEFKKLEAGVTSEVQRVEGATSRFIAEVKKDI